MTGTISKEEALDVPPDPIVVRGAEEVCFVQSMGAGDLIPLPNGETVRFHVSIDNRTGERFLGGTYRTADPTMIEALRAVAATGVYSVYEIQ